MSPEEQLKAMQYEIAKLHGQRMELDQHIRNLEKDYNRLEQKILNKLGEDIENFVNDEKSVDEDWLEAIGGIVAPGKGCPKFFFTEEVFAVLSYYSEDDGQRTYYVDLQISFGQRSKTLVRACTRHELVSCLLGLQINSDVIHMSAERVRNQINRGEY